MRDGVKMQRFRCIASGTPPDFFWVGAAKPISYVERP